MSGAFRASQRDGEQLQVPATARNKQRKPGRRGVGPGICGCIRSFAPCPLRPSMPQQRRCNDRSRGQVRCAPSRLAPLPPRPAPPCTAVRAHCISGPSQPSGASAAGQFACHEGLLCEPMIFCCACLLGSALGALGAVAVGGGWAWLAWLLGQTVQLGMRQSRIRHQSSRNQPLSQDDRNKQRSTRH